MPFRQIDTIRIYQFDHLAHFPLTHAIVTRRGGVSPPPWESLNAGGSVGDEPERVEANLQRLFDAMGRRVQSKYDVWQIHSAKAHIVCAPRGCAEPARADILITRSPEVTLLMRFADCVPIMLYDPRQHATALVHAGREGLAKKAPQAAVEALMENYGSQAEDLIAAIGPSICVDCYPIGTQMAAELRSELGSSVETHLKSQGGRIHFDLWSCAREMLLQAGVKTIEVAEICTAMNLDDWYSHRAENGKTGRFAAILALSA